MKLLTQYLIAVGTTVLLYWAIIALLARIDVANIPEMSVMGGNASLAVAMVTSRLISAAAYVSFAFAFYRSSKWGRNGGEWRETMISLAAVFIATAVTSVAGAIVSFWPLHMLQLALSWAAVSVIAVGAFRIWRANRSLYVLVEAVKSAVKQARF